jgi:uncharacterized membrane protein YfcA
VAEYAGTVAIGVAAGVLSGMFGIGGGVITTPAIRLLLGAPALIAVGTPLPVIIPGSLTGAVSYARAGLSDVRTGVLMGLGGSATAVLGAWLATRAGGTTVMLATAVLVVWMAADMLLQAFRRPRSEARIGAGEADPALASERGADARSQRPRTAVALAIGGAAGLYSGFLGLGGGFVLVPLMTRFLGFDMKRAVGTSLAAISVLSIPGSVTHALLGNVDWRIATALVIGVVPGALLGSRLALRARDRWLQIGFATLLVAAAALLAANELGWRP